MRLGIWDCKDFSPSRPQSKLEDPCGSAVKSDRTAAFLFVLQVFLVSSTSCVSMSQRHGDMNLALLSGKKSRNPAPRGNLNDVLRVVDPPRSLVVRVLFCCWP